MEVARATLAVFLYLFVGSCHGAKFFLTAPEKPHLDSPYTVTVSASDIGYKESISLEYRSVKNIHGTLNSTVMSFDKDGIKTWTVVFPWGEMSKFGDAAVILAMRKKGSEKTKTLYFSKSTGYIFIQTDKPLYTPRQTVRFRVIAVDEHQRLAPYPLKVDIKNEKSVIVDRMRYSAEDAFKGQEFTLPKETPSGNWSISASFEEVNNAQSKVHTISFEVKEYVLPRFSASVEISKDVITNSTHWITITVTAKYVYGQKAAGSVEMELGVWGPRTGVKLLPGKYTGNLKNGVFIKKIHIRKLLPTTAMDEANKRLYINVNVTEEGTKENDTIIDTSTFIAHPYYEIAFKSSKTSFSAGYPYTFHAQVRARTGRPASRAKLSINVQYLDRFSKVLSTKSLVYDLDKDGKLMKTYNTLNNADRIKFKVKVLDSTEGSDNEADWMVKNLRHPSGEYLHIDMVKPVTKYSDGLVKLRYTQGIHDDLISLLVLARGHIVYSKSIDSHKSGLSTVPIPRLLYAEISPSMRVVAYYGDDAVYSLQVDTDPVCLEELSLGYPGTFVQPIPKKPKENFKLQLRGGAKMHVGMVAVDTAVFLLNNAHTLTRKSMFDQLASHDQGTVSGDGHRMEQILKNSGLVHMILKTTRVSAQSIHPARKSFGRKHKIKRVFSQTTSTRHQVLPLLVRKGKAFGLEGGFGGGSQGRSEDAIDPVEPSFYDPPPQTARKFFPETWLFDEYILPKSGQMDLNLTLPDSITTWSFIAVGLSSTRGVCVSPRLVQRVQKLFFVDIRIPYKVTRLEEVKVKVAIYNYHTYPISIKAVVSGSDGLCFSSNQGRGTQKNSTSFALHIAKGGVRSKEIKVIPLTNGLLTLRVDVYNKMERDIVERQIYVVAEGLRLRKSLTFVLDPEAKHARYNRPNRRGLVTLANTSTIQNTVDLKRKLQKTKIDLAMPIEVIRGTENCHISAFGDLLGDIIDHAVIKSKNLLEQTVQNAEEVLGELGPTVHALLYANQSGLMDAELKKRARRFVTHGVARLLKYRKDDESFGLTPSSPSATWLTTAVLKTLCHASSLAFVDKEQLIDYGFSWLFMQVTENQTLVEKDWRLAKDSWDYQVMLSAEVLISLMECGRAEFEEHSVLLYDMAYLLEDNIDKIEEPMILAKVAYALTLFDKTSKAKHIATRKLFSIRKTNPQGQMFWSSEKVADDNKKVPFWYRKGVKASAVEATAYALLVFQNHPKTDAIADWLVSQRNQHGMFVSALDSMSAIQALSANSLKKKGLKVDLSCNVTSDKIRESSHSFTFSKKNAINPSSWNNVPVGHTLEVLTKGQGLGQMQVNVEYNVPIDPNEKCPFNVTIEVKSTEVNFHSDMIDDPLCMSCSWGCRMKEENMTAMNITAGNNTDTANITSATIPTTTTTTTRPVRIKWPSRPKISRPKIRFPPRGRKRPRKRPRGNHRNPKLYKKQPWTRVPRVKGRTQRVRGKFRSRVRGIKRRRKSRSIRQHRHATPKSICFRLCLQHLESGYAGYTLVEVNMLTGFLPVDSDIDRLKTQDNIADAVFVKEKDSVMVSFKQVSDEEKTCIAFRAVDQEEVGRPTPANVIVTEIGNPAPSCALEYTSPSLQESLQVYCADVSNFNRGECHCYSDICSSCIDLSRHEQVKLSGIMNQVCQSDIGYQLQLSNIQDRDQWVEIDAKVVSVNRTGSHNLKAEDSIKMISPSSCPCPRSFRIGKEAALYMLSADVEKMVDRYGKTKHVYLLDEQSKFLRVRNPYKKLEEQSKFLRVRNPYKKPPKYRHGHLSDLTVNHLTVNHSYLRHAFKNCPR